MSSDATPVLFAPVAKPAPREPRALRAEYVPVAPLGFADQLTAPGLAAEPTPANPMATPQPIPQGADILRAALGMALKDRASLKSKRLMALTLAGPWGYAVDQLGKRVENRTRGLFRLNGEPYRIVLLHVGKDDWGRPVSSYAESMASMYYMASQARQALKQLVLPNRNGARFDRQTMNDWRWSEEATPEFAVCWQRMTDLITSIEKMRTAMYIGAKAVREISIKDVLTPPTGVPSSAIIGVMAVYSVERIQEHELAPWGVPGAYGHAFTYAPLAAPVRCVQGAQGLWSAMKAPEERQDEIIQALQHSIEQDRWSDALLSNNTEDRSPGEWQQPTEKALQKDWSRVEEIFNARDPNDGP
jgi:hypothetical protein